jgi:polyisoprenoid-binding protein YceI
MLKRLLSALPLLLVFSAPADAAPDRYVFDKDHTHIFFHVSHLGFSQMWGRIKDYDGYFTFDEKEPWKSEVDVTLHSASVDTDVPALNKVLISDKFLNVDKYPTMHFKSTAVNNIGPAGVGGQSIPKPHADIVGDLTLLGVTRPVVLHVIYNKSGVHTYTNNYVSGFSADAVIKRSDFGMSAYIPDVGDEIHIHIEVEGTDPLKHPGNIKTPH